MTKYEKVILDYDIPLTSSNIPYFFDEYNGNWRIAFFENPDEESIKESNWIYEYETDESHWIQHVFYIKDLTRRDQKIDYGDIEIEKGIPGAPIPVHLKIISHQKKLNIWWRKFAEIIFQKSKEALASFIPPASFFENKSDEEFEMDQSRKSALLPWEQIEDKRSNRKILELWWSGYTNSEIARKVDLDPRTVTNILSRLRMEYKQAIVPTKNQIIIQLREKKESKVM
jgi:hypothetical protein